MRKMLRRFVRVVVIVLVLLAFAGFAASRLIDVDAWRADLAAALSTRLGLDVRIDGKLHLELGLRPDVVVSGVEIHEPGSTGAPPIARLEAAAFEADLLRSYRERRVVISQVRASGVEVALVRNAEGVGNWQFRTARPPSASGAPVLALDHILLEDARVTYSTALSDWAFELDVDRLDVSSPGSGSRLTGEATGTVQGQDFSLAVTSDSDEVEQLGILGDRSAIEMDATVTVGPVELRAVGHVQNPRGRASSDLVLTIHMDDLGEVRKLARFTDKVDLAGIGALDARGRLIGGGGSVRLEEVVASVVSETNGRVDATGRIGDLVHVADIDLAVEVTTPDAAAVTARLRIPRPEVRAAKGTGALRGRWPEITFQDVDVSATHRLGGDVRVQGEVSRIGKQWAANLAFAAETEHAEDIATMIEEVVESIRRDKSPVLLGRPDLQLQQIVMAIGPAHVTGRVKGRGKQWGLSSVAARAGTADVDWFRARGGIASLVPQPTGIVFDVEAGSDDLGPLMVKAGVPLKGLERLRLSGRVAGNADRLMFRGMQAIASTPDRITIGLSGDLPLKETVVDTEVLVAISARDLGVVGEVIGRPMFDLGPFELSAEVRAEGGGLVWQGATMGIGESLITGSFRVEEGERRPRVTANLQSDRLRLEDLGLAPARKQEDTPDAAPVGMPAWIDRPLPFDALRALDGALALRVTHLVGRGGLDIEDVDVRTRLDDGLLEIDDLTLVYQGGRLRSALRLDAGSQPPEIEVRLAGDGLRIERVLAQFVEERVADGTAQVVADLRSQGITARELGANLDGDMLFYGREGGLAMRYSRALQLDFGSSASRRAAAGELEEVECLIVDASARNGRLTVETVLFDTAEKQVLGAGDVDLASEQVDLMLTPVFKRTIPGSVATAVRIHGPLLEPDVTPAPLITASAAAQGLVDRALLPLTRILPGVGSAVAEVRRSADRALEGTGVTLPATGLWRPGIDVNCDKVLNTERIEALRSEDTVQPG